MFRWKLFFFFAIIFGINAYSQENTANPFNFKWDNGFRLESEDKQFVFNFGGRLLIDHAYFHQHSDLINNYGSLESKSGTEFRNARLFFSGNIYGNTYFKFQLDFAGANTTIKDAYIGISNIPALGNLQIGHFKEPFRFVMLTSSKYLTLMEPAANSSFAQSRNNGAMIFNDFMNNRLSAQLGVFRNANNDSNDVFADDGYVLTGRITGIPYKNNSGKQLLHIGGAYSYRRPASREYKITIPPSSHLAEKYLSTEIVSSVDNVGLANFEMVYLHNSFSIQAEYLTSSLNTVDNDYNFSTYYAELSYFITGENKNYKGSYQAFGRVKPNNNFGGTQKGFGALELALRYSKTDLSDKTINGGNQSELVLGFNWYLNPVTRVMVNYARTNIENNGNLDIFQARFQIDF